MGRDQLNAVIFVRRGDGASGRVAGCWDHCQRRGYHTTAVLGDWAEVVEMVMSGRAEVVVVHSRDDLPPGRVPRVEVAGEAPPSWPTRRTGRL
jgi:hypothetical protein